MCFHEVSINKSDELSIFIGEILNRIFPLKLTKEN